MSATLVEAVQAFFGEQGPLAADDPDYRRRPPQEAMAMAAAQALDDRACLVVEAGTGVGKTYAYLVPLLLSGVRALVSTATKSLQDQLFHRDLPRLLRRLQRPTTVALLKGRASYVCLHRLAAARLDARLVDPQDVRILARIESWAAATVSGDLAEVDGLDERSPVIPVVTSTRENCLGTDCPRWTDCHVVRARREALAADVVVINHHLFFADMALRDTGVAELLPTADALVFDEAHQLPEVGVTFLGSSLGSAQLQDLGRDVMALGLAHARGWQPWPELVAAVDLGWRDLRMAALAGQTPPPGGLKLRWRDRVTERPVASRSAAEQGFREALDRLGQALTALVSALAAVGGAHADLDRLQGRAQDMATLATRLAQPADDGRVRWIDLGAHHLRLLDAPLDVRQALDAQRSVRPRTWIFTSATLGDDDALSWFTERTGLEDARRLRLGSPYDYAQRARLWVPGELPPPADPGHARAVALTAARCAEVLGGRTFLLATTSRAVVVLAAVLRERWARIGSPLVVLVQGEAPKRVLLERFLAAQRQGAGALLVGTHSFWEGIDIPGTALQCVVIDKLPFPPPDDPIVEARAQRVRQAGRNAFDACFLAEASLALKQGAGRLIRRETDRGLLVIGDRRLIDQPYGARLLSALPPMRRLDDAAQVRAWLEDLAACSEGGAP